MVSGGYVKTFGSAQEPVSMGTIGDGEAAFLREIADAVAGRAIGVHLLGRMEDGFVIAAEQDGVTISFTSPNPKAMKDAFVEWALLQP